VVGRAAGAAGRAASATSGPPINGTGRARVEEELSGFASGGSSGNKAFDEYREATLKRLEEEQRDFHTFLDKLRQAKDKAEFDQFMADRRNNPPAPPSGPSVPQV
jgi:hypothetical protein